MPPNISPLRKLPNSENIKLIATFIFSERRGREPTNIPVDTPMREPVAAVSKMSGKLPPKLTFKM